MPDWNAIEADYMATGMSYQRLAKKWGVSISTLKKKAMKGKWSERCTRTVKAAEKKVVVRPRKEPKKEPSKEPEPLLDPSEPYEIINMEELCTELRAQRARKMIEATDALMDRVINALDLIAPDNTYALMTLVRSLKEIREMQGLNRSALDIEEQQLRIQKLKREARAEEESNEVVVSIRGMSQDEVAEVIG